MNIILLSGGSGKRLWPLSNDIRSKQFIQIFKNANGAYESMVQRMYRQIKKADRNARVTVATSKIQVSELKNQLGDNVGISVEPSRRDTFPAIALAGAYLNEVQHVDRDEVVIVCPVDPYVDDDYFEALKQLAAIVEKGQANLTLLGMEPTNPSEKFGYIIPTSSAPVSPVSSFREKPKAEVAAEYIKQGALWNMGVFAFRLGYLLDRAHELINFEDYDDLFVNYANAQKTSFDYAVVENEKSIQVLRFSGRWDDLGTWESLTNAMSEKTIGKVISKDCENTRIINELDIPVLALGVNNILFAASSDGILVSSVERSNEIKPIVEQIETNEIRYAEKSWGEYQVIDMTPDSLTVSMLLKAGKRMSYHSHLRRDEVWTIVSGSGTAIVDGMSQHVHAGDVISIAAGCRHTLIAQEDLKVIEVQLGREINVSDKQKFDYE